MGLIPPPSRTARVGPRPLRRRKLAAGPGVAALQSNAATVGITLNLIPKPFDQVLSVAGGNCAVARLPCHRGMATPGGGWSFGPDCQLNEIASHLEGAAPLSPTLSINPENWYFAK